MAVKKKTGFGPSFLEWIEVVLKNHESCVIYTCTTTRYFRLQKRACLGDPISAYLFILVLEILFYLRKTSNKMKL